MQQIRLEVTEDGSHTLFSPESGEHYHSIHGAKQESEHVFLQTGFEMAARFNHQIRLLEIGFGTGLNCLLTLRRASELKLPVEYHGIEPFPVAIELCQNLNYCDNPEFSIFTAQFHHMHSVAAGLKVALGQDFYLLKINHELQQADLAPDFYNLVYFDAFSPESAPDLWQLSVFEKVRNSMQTGGVLVTYCAKGAVRRFMQQSGFRVERLPGPPGKREMLRATAI
ncbi:MAG: tRNA (5-methylaminomethyl-2-thiouridine)(34)-methyltransferase MnmD [Lentimicrobiaceae bacterium]|nr:tRNA (5-methylaminomethyl-2-thiouridine)(34)-methyltransferase MnmD [Lentimicrobiaceae bacterium]MCB9023723.1 tRNA (5-methylaminomethyl-2-thiouridine)(34)-methyltransferase MnmD [Lentimicrobiaceae bacterium]MCO5266244.1 tRNA (5-methylaminomethyl-2-thiouridine)(34)-methyltransferase MnmD [Lentimicrobium sp.]